MYVKGGEKKIKDKNKPGLCWLEDKDGWFNGTGLGRDLELIWPQVDISLNCLKNKI